MKIYPAIDIKSGRAVRLLQGKADKATDYGNPVEAAVQFEKLGARRLHIVDLDGAFDGESKNIDAITDIIRSISIPIQLGGGIRTMQDIEDRITRGVGRVILGTAACENPELVAIAVNEFPGKIAVGIDAFNGYAAIRGWVDTTHIKALELAMRMKDLGVDTIIYTDISRDGMQTGPNFEAMRTMAENSKMNVIASGGVGSLEDLKLLKETKVYGAIVGKALYSGAVILTDAIKLEENYAD